MAWPSTAQAPCPGASHSRGLADYQRQFVPRHAPDAAGEERGPRRLFLIGGGRQAVRHAGNAPASNIQPPAMSMLVV